MLPRELQLNSSLATGIAMLGARKAKQDSAQLSAEKHKVQDMSYAHLTNSLEQTLS
jgi:hypothetical protein